MLSNSGILGVKRFFVRKHPQIISENIVYAEDKKIIFDYIKMRNEKKPYLFPHLSSVVENYYHYYLS